MGNLKVLIVDDEMLSRAGVRSCVDWQEQGFELVGEAENGRQALKRIGELEPDVLFTDIKMPVMDGIELTRAVLKERPRMKVVILSCYSDFGYVKEAMQLGAYDYLLKLSMKPKDLTALLRRLRSDLEEEERRRQEEELRRSEIDSKLSLLREEYLRRLLLEDIVVSEEDFDRQRGSLGLRLDYHHTSVIALQIERERQEESDGGRGGASEYAVACREILEDSIRGELCTLGKDRLAAILCFAGENGADERKLRIERLADRLGRALEKHGLGLSAGVSYGCQPLHACSSLYREACHALKGRFFSEGNYIGFHDPLHAGPGGSIRIRLESERRLAAALELNAERECFAVLGDLADELAAKRELHPDAVIAAWKEVLYIIRRTVKGLGGDLRERLGEDPLVRAGSLERFSHLRGYVEQVAEAALDCIAACKRRRFRAEVVRVLDYLRTDLSRNVPLKEAARIAGLSEKYFCKVFKEETGRNYIDYVQMLKMEQAKELLKNQNARIYEIAFSLGFENESYFCKRFKQYTGVTAYEFKQSLQDNG